MIQEIQSRCNTSVSKTSIMKISSILSLVFAGLMLTGISPETTVIHAQPTDPEFGCRHAHGGIQPGIAFTRRSEEALNIKLRSDTLNLFHYEIHLDVTDFQGEQIRGRTIVNLEALMDSIKNITLDLEGLVVDSIKRDGEHLTFSHDGRYIRIRENEKLNKGDTVYAEVYYGGTPITCPSGFGGFYFEQGYAYNLGIGLAADPHNFGRAWIPCFDNFVQRSTFEYHVKTSGGRRAHCVGRFIGEENIGGDTIIRSYFMEQPIPTYLSSVAISNYSTRNWTHDGRYGPVDIELIARSGDLDNFEASLEDLGAAIDALEYWYGPYPFERIGYVITTRGAMEHPTNTAYPASSIAGGNKSTRLMAHELAHHWWGNVTTLTTSHDMWIKEGPAEYGAHLTEEELHGHEGLRSSVRSNHFSTIRTAHQIDGDYYALSPMPPHNTYGRHTYNRGASMMHNLRGYLGDSLYRHSMREVLNNNYFSDINAERFRDELSAYSGIDLTDFFDDWIFAPGYSDFNVDSFQVLENAGEQYRVAIYFRQQKHHSPHLHNGVPMQVTFGSGMRTQTAILTAGGAFSVDTATVDFKPDWVVLNERQHLNLASFSSLHLFTGTGSTLDAHTNSRIITNQIADSVLFFIEHHLSPPQEVRSEEPDFRISDSHYFKIGGSYDENWDATVILRYTGRGSFPLDSSLTAQSEDSLILVYRPDPSVDWVEHPDYFKNVLLPNDGNGFININTPLPGEYAFANSFFKEPSTVSELVMRGHKLKVYPNPGPGIFKLQSEYLDGKYDIKIHDGDGRLVKRLNNLKIHPQTPVKIDIGGESPGVYFIQLTTAGTNHSDLRHSVVPVILQ